MNKKLVEQKGAIENGFQTKRDELLREQNMSNVSLTAMERILEEVKSLNEQISQLKQQRSILEDDTNDTQFSRTKLEAKVVGLKQRQITDEVKLEQNLKSELESKKLQLDQL